MEQKEKQKLNLKNDVVFKAFFSRKGNEEYLIDFLKALLKIEIKSIIIREEVSLEKLNENEKGGRLDLQAVLDNNTIVNIEMQVKNYHDIEQRTTFYSSKVITKETRTGTAYKDIQMVIMINILDFEIFETEEYVSDTVIVLNKHREKEALTGIKWYFIELPKFRKQNPDMEDKLNQWLAFIDDNNGELIKMAEEKNKTIEKARKEMKYLTGDAEVQRLAELREKWEMEYNSAKADGFSNGREVGRKEGLETGRKEGLETGRKEGLETGRKEGLETGRKEGLEAGRKEGLETGRKEGIEAGKKEGIEAGKKEGIEVGRLEAIVENAKEMLKDDVSIEKISKYTGLTKEEIEKLKK